MFVAKAFNQIGSVIQSDYYTDYETGKLREIDVMAYCTTGVEKLGHEHFIQVGYSIECKLATDKPWLLFAAQPDSLYVDEDNRSTIAHPFLPALAVSSKIGEWLLKKVALSSYHNPKGFEGYGSVEAYGITQAFTTGQDVPYQAVNSTFKAATARSKKIDDDNRVASAEVSYSSIIFPTVVIDGRLFECYLNKDAQLTMQEVKFGILNWNIASDGLTSKKIHIVTKPALSELVERVDKATKSIQEACERLGLLDELIEFKQKVY